MSQKDSPQYYYRLFMDLIWGWSFVSSSYTGIYPGKMLPPTGVMVGLGLAKGGEGGHMDACGGMNACDENEGITAA